MAPENNPWKRRFLLETIIFSGENISFREGIFCWGGGKAGGKNCDPQFMKPIDPIVISWVVPPPRIPVANEGLVRDPRS